MFHPWNLPLLLPESEIRTKDKNVHLVYTFIHLNLKYQRNSSKNDWFARNGSARVPQLNFRVVFIRKFRNKRRGLEPKGVPQLFLG